MRWLGHVLRMENSRLPKKLLLSEPEIGWKRSRGGQVMTWHRGMKEATRKLAAVGQCRLPGWDQGTQHINGCPLSKIWLATVASGALAATF